MTTQNQHWAEACFEAFLEIFGKLWPAFGPVIICTLLFFIALQLRALIDGCSRGGDQ